MPKTIKNAKQVQDRSRGIEVLNVIKETEDGVAYAVRSGSDESVVYTTGIMKHPLREGEFTTFCNCKWGSFKKPRNGESCACSHVAAVMSHHARRQNSEARNVSFWTEEEAAKRQHRPVINLESDNVFATMTEAPIF